VGLLDLSVQLVACRRLVAPNSLSLNSWPFYSRPAYSKVLLCCCCNISSTVQSAYIAFSSHHAASQTISCTMNLRSTADYQTLNHTVPQQIPIFMLR